MKQQTDCLFLRLAVLLCAVSLLIGGRLYAQPGSIKVSGKVYDQNDRPVIGAGVMIKGTNTGAITDADGSFTLTVPGEKTVLVVSSLGFLPQEVEVGKRVLFDFFLEEDRQNILLPRYLMECHPIHRVG